METQAWIGMAALVAALALLATVAALAFSLGRSRGRASAEEGLGDLVSSERRDAIKRSRAVLGGLAAEQLAPWLPGFPWNPGELRFIGKPIDFLVFRGAAEGRIDEVVFVEVKTGGATLSGIERALRDAVREKRVSWAEWRPPQN
jgi:predicted Holliday junction resolvase-like endonuclease